ncbi:MAG: flagellar biosynthetic protein FliO [Enterococcus sp.]|nr:flagellar biosynthetic protein FliO [Enterococcus sp.]
METFLSLVKMIGFLLLILYLINISLKYLNRYTNQHNHQLRILQKIAVSKSSSIGIVQIMDKCYVMSFSEQQNQIIKELTPEETAAFLQQSLESTQVQAGKDFSEWLNKAKAEIARKRGKQK